MVEIIQENRKPRFSEQLLSGLGRAAEVGSQAIPQGLMQKEQQKAQQMQMAKENEALSSLVGQDLSNIQDPAIKKSIVDNLLKGQQNQQQDFQKQLGKQQEEQQIKNVAQNSFNTMATLLKKNNLGRGSWIKSLAGGKTAEDVGAFQSASGGLEAILVDMVNRGTLSNSRFKYITETLLPQYDDTDAKIKGKMKSLGAMLGLDISALEDAQDAQSNEETSQEKVLDQEAMDKIYDLAKGDKKEIMRIARKMGYKI